MAGRAARQASSSRESGSPSAIASLVATLQAADDSVVRAARSLWDLAAHSGASRAAIVAAGAIELLVGVLRGSNESAQEAAIAVLWHLTLTEDAAINASAFAAASALPHLALLHEVGSEADQWCRVESVARRAEVTEMGGVPPLISLLSSANPALQRGAAGVLSNICASHEATRRAVVESGGVAPLVALLLGGAGSDVQKFAATALQHLAISNGANRSAIVAANAIPPLIVLLDSSVPSVQGAAAAALGNLVQDSGPNKEQV